MKQLLVIEDGSEYVEFARMFLQPEYAVQHARSAAATLEALSSAAKQRPIGALLIDLRFDRAPTDQLIGDVAQTAAKMFGGNQGRALRYLQDQQGILILEAVRAQGYSQRAVFVHDFPERRLANLQRLYGDVGAVPTFDAAAIVAALRGGA